ncbi:carbon starvation CstA family protein [Helicobacter ailurogastricus]|uniref:Carbon starvation protein A n=1 Tax=Helicobacter ailurogastricus TaxID=1578720 RepID=A0A0K2XBY9_9HELI|nr:carbon starvation CstA family protein [Helicobacter ailurogastricus]CRF40498.1 Carbon starvation protein A [Helicobacter ailurogastricus]CRF42789.1 Carbon starvation protein A [Helicobacter ailurogastricus]CRF44845.1 Carbon starvation protein A [Helicobacter ailurogastricus]
MQQFKALLWGLVAIMGAVALSVLALHKGESINTLWLVCAAVCIYSLGYRFYSHFVAYKVLRLNDKRATPACVFNDGRDFVPTHKAITFGHHFAAIAGAGPLVGPILAAQMGYLPSILWILIGSVLGGCVHDFIVLFCSMRRSGRSLGEMIKDEMGPFVGWFAMLGTLGIMVIIIAILAMVVVKALAHSPWGLFTIACTIPIAIFMGLYMRFLRPKVLESSLIGFALLLLAIYYGKVVANDPTLASYFTLKASSLAWIIIAYGFVASILPVWFLLAPRDYLSTFLKIGVVLILALALVVVAPPLHLPKLTHFVDGSGPVFAGALFPFLFITIACGTISGFHALIASGTTPKIIAKESHARLVGYGSMLMESVVALMALLMAGILHPGLYFAINAPQSTIGSDIAQAVRVINSWGFQITPQEITSITKHIGEQSILSRTGGAPTFAIGLSLLVYKVVGHPSVMAFWYHFAILFEALFILTAVDAGTRTARFMIQDILGHIYKPLGNTNSYAAGIVATLLAVGLWGYFLYQGTIDPKGGIYTLWPLFGVSNQMLAGMALLLGTTVLFKMGRFRHALVSALPAVFILFITFYSGILKVLPKGTDPILNKVSHVATAQILSEKLTHATDPKQASLLKQAIFNHSIDAILCVFFMLVALLVLVASARICLNAYKGRIAPPLAESAFVAVS